MNTERKPLTKATERNGDEPEPLESTEPWTVRVEPRLRTSMRGEAKKRRQTESEYARDCLSIGHKVFTAIRVGEGYIRVPA